MEFRGVIQSETLQVGFDFPIFESLTQTTATLELVQHVSAEVSEDLGGFAVSNTDAIEVAMVYDHYTIIKARSWDPKRM